MQLNRFQRFLHKIGLLVVKENIVVKTIKVPERCAPLSFQNESNGISYEVVGVDFEKGTLTLKFFGSTDGEDIHVSFSNLEYEQIDKSIFKFKVKQLCLEKEQE